MKEECIVAYTDDPVIRHVLEHFKKIKSQNKRFRNYIKKTGNWLKLKKVESWKPYDFYNYFCYKYQDQYKKEYKLSGNEVRAYARIESFIAKNNIENKDYKEFIDLAYAKYFNNIVTPKVGNICSPSLYKRLMKENVEYAKTEDLFEVDQKIARENEEFNQIINESGAIRYG